MKKNIHMPFSFKIAVIFAVCHFILLFGVYKFSFPYLLILIDLPLIFINYYLMVHMKIHHHVEVAFLFGGTIMYFFIGYIIGRHFERKTSYKIEE